MLRKGAYDPTPIYKVRSDGEMLAGLRNQLAESGLAPLNDALHDAAEKLAAEVEGLDYEAARLIATATALDGVRTLLAVATADARAAGVPMMSTAQALGYTSATPLQKDADLLRRVREGRERANETNEVQTVEGFGSWTYELNPMGEAVSADETPKRVAKASKKPTADQILAMEAEFEAARRKA